MAHPSGCAILHDFGDVLGTDEHDGDVDRFTRRVGHYARSSGRPTRCRIAGFTGTAPPGTTELLRTLL